MTLAYTVVLSIDNPEEARITDEIREEYRSEVYEAINHRLEMHGFEGRIIDQLGLTVDHVEVAPSLAPVTDDERTQLQLLADAEKHLSSSVIRLSGALGLEADHVRRTDLEIIVSALKKQQRRIEGFSRRLHRKLMEDRARQELQDP